MTHAGLEEKARTGAERCGGETREWWKASHSMEEIAERLEATLRDKQDLEWRLKEVLAENAALHSQCERVAADIQARIRESSESRQTPADGKGRQAAELKAKENLIRDEYERKLQALQTEFQKERFQFRQVVAKMKTQLSRCICSDSSLFVVNPEFTDSEGSDALFKNSSAAQPRRQSWMLRNSR